MIPADERLLISLWTELWRIDMGPVVARMRAPTDAVLRDLCGAYRARIRRSLLADEFRGEDNMTLRREIAGRDPKILVDPRWIDCDDMTRREARHGVHSFLDVAVRCRALQLRPWHLRQEWTTRSASSSPNAQFSYDEVRAYSRRGEWRAWYGVAEGVFATRDEAEEWVRSSQSLPLPPGQTAGVERVRPRSPMHDEMERRITELRDAHEREIWAGRRPPPELAETIDRLQRQIVEMSRMPDELLGADLDRYTNQLLGIPRTSDDRADAMRYAWRDLAERPLTPRPRLDADERRASERLEMRFSSLGLRVSVDHAAVRAAMLADDPVRDNPPRPSCNPPRPSCQGCGCEVPTFVSSCDRCASAKAAVHLLVAIIEQIRVACAVTFMAGICSFARLDQVVAGVQPDGHWVFLKAPDRHVGVCSKHGVVLYAVCDYCGRCHLEAESRRVALGLLHQIVLVAGRCLWESLDDLTKRVCQLDHAPSRAVAHDDPPHERPLELGAPPPYVAPADQPLPERASAVDEAHGVRELLLEIN